MSTLVQFFRHRSRLVLILFAVVNVAVLLLLYRRAFVSYPIGWDAPYYINSVRELLEHGVMPQRLGFVAVVAGVHLVTRISISTILVWLTPTIMVGMAIGAASLVSAVTNRSRVAWCLAFLATLWSSQTLALSMGTYDNAFAMAMIFVALWIVRWSHPSWRRALLLGLTAVVIGLTHLETYILFMFMTVLYEGVRWLRYRRWGAWWHEEKDVFSALAVALLITVWHWAAYLSKLLTFYTTTADPEGNASIPYAQSSTLGSYFTYAKTGLPTTLFLCIAGVSVVMVGVMMLRRRQRILDLFACYIVAGYLVLAFAVVRGSIPINRAVLLVPVNVLLGYGWYVVVRYVSRIRVVSSMFVVLMAYVLLAAPVNFVDTMKRYTPSIRPSTYAAYQSLAAYVRDHHISTYVVVADIPTNEHAASAYYGLWTNWLAATRPANTMTNAYCIYFGNLASYRNRVAATRPQQQEYNDTTKEGLRCTKSLTTDPVVFVIKDIQPAAFPLNDWYATTDVVAPHLGVVSFPPSTLRP